MPRINNRLEEVLKIIKNKGIKSISTREMEERAENELYGKKSHKIGEIMEAKSKIKKINDKYEISTDMKVKKGLGPKGKKALKISVNKALDHEFKGGKINLDYSSDEEPKKPTKKNIDVKELKNYAKILSHLLEHIEDPSEPIDKKDYKDAKQLINNMETVKRRGRPIKN